MSAQEKLTATLWDAIQQLTQTQKARVLLNAAITLIDNGQYGDEVENYIDVYLQTPGLPKKDVEKALLARNNARELSGEQLLAKDLHTLDPSKEQSQLPCRAIHFSIEPAWQRAPPEIWEQVAAHTPNYFLRTWLFLSRFHWDIASRHIFHTIDIDFGWGEEDVVRGIEILCYAKSNPIFASRVKSLRTYWHGNYEEMLSLLLQLLKTHLPAFTALRNFECIELRENPAEMVQALLDTHKDLNGLGLISWSFRRIEIPFDNLRKFSLRTEEDESHADVKELRKVLDRNDRTLKHLILGGGPSKDRYWDWAFKSLTINNLTHLDLVESFFISHFVLTRIASIDNLQSLNLCGSFLDPYSASVLFASDRIVNGTHSLMPHLEAFRLAPEYYPQSDSDSDDDDDEVELYCSIIHFLRKRENLRRLDLGGCVWDSDMIQKILPDLGNLRVIGISVQHLYKASIKSLVESIPKQVVAIKLSVEVSDETLDKYAHYFTRFNNLSFLSFRPRRPAVQTTEVLVGIATTVPLSDFLGWSGDLYVTRNVIMGKMNKVTSIDVAGDDASWLEMKDVYRERVRLLD